MPNPAAKWQIPVYESGLFGRDFSHVGFECTDKVFVEGWEIVTAGDSVVTASCQLQFKLPLGSITNTRIKARICIMEIANANVLFGFVKKSMPMTRRANASKNREKGVYAFLSIVESPSFY